MDVLSGTSFSAQDRSLNKKEIGILTLGSQVSGHKWPSLGDFTHIVRQLLLAGHRLPQQLLLPVPFFLETQISLSLSSALHKLQPLCHFWVSD